MGLGSPFVSPGKRPTTGESGGKGLRRTGDWTATGTGWVDVWERKAAKDEMAMEAKVEGFARGGEEEGAEEAASLGRSDGLAACILSSILDDNHDLAQMGGPRGGGEEGLPTRLFAKGEAWAQAS